MTAKWGYNPQTPDGVGEGKSLRRRASNPPHTTALFWALWFVLFAAFVIWQLA